MSQVKFYRPEKNANLIFILVWILIMIIGTISLSYLYSLVSKFMPIIYLCVLITGFFGLALGYLARFTSKVFRITNKREILIIVLLCGFIAVYSSWVAYISGLGENYYSNSSFSEYASNLELWLNPTYVFDIIKNINSIGLWEIFGTGTPISGTALWVVWIIEALIIISSPILAISSYQISPYSARTNKWYKKYTLNKQFRSMINVNSSTEQMSKNPEDTIDGWSIGETNRHALVTIYFIEEESKQYLKVENLRYDREGKLTNSKVVINNLEISTQSAINLIKKYHGSKEIFFD